MLKPELESYESLERCCCLAYDLTFLGSEIFVSSNNRCTICILNSLYGCFSHIIVVEYSHTQPE